MSGARGRGRPPKAAQSLEEAWDRACKGDVPPRPRNEFERAAFGKRPGRKPAPQSPTQQAVQLAVYLVRAYGVSIRSAAAHAAAEFLVNERNVRTRASAALRGPVSVISVPVAPMLGQLLRGSLTHTVPLMVNPDDPPTG